MAAIPAVAAVFLDGPGHVFSVGDAPEAHGGKPGTSWTLLDWRGRPTGRTGFFDDCGEARLMPLPAGYYRLACDDSAPTLAVLPRQEGRILPSDSFYGVMSGQSVVSAPGRISCPWNGGDTFRTASDLLRLAGIPNVRDFTYWESIHPSPGVFDGGKYLYNAELLHARGIGVSGMLLHCPSWMDRLDKIPSDLAAVHDSCKTFAANFGDAVDCWEFWNEEDISYASEPVWDYVSALKAAYLGFKAGRHEAIVLHGALALTPGSPYASALYDNDAAKFSDAFNWHTYAPIASYHELLATLRDLLERAGIGNRAVWITECGTNLEGPASVEVPEAVAANLELRGSETAMKRMMSHSPEQELVVAEFYPKAQIAMQMEGVARNYFFVFGAYNERDGTKDWGMLRRDGTVKPVFSAMSTMMREVGMARLQGEIHVGVGLRAYLFDQPDGSQTVAFWSVSPLDTAKDGMVVPEPGFERTMRLELPMAAAHSPMADSADADSRMPSSECRLADLCGIGSTVKMESGVLELEASRFPAYVSGLHGLEATVRARHAGVVGASIPESGEDLTVVLRAEFDPRDFDLSDNKTRAVCKGTAGRVRVLVWNLGDAAKSGRVEVAGCTMEGLPETIELGPLGSPPVQFDCTMAPDGDAATYGTMVLTGVFDGRRSSRLSSNFAFPTLRFADCIPVELAWRKPENWKRNDSADKFSMQWDDSENALRFDMVWNDPESVRWFYPTYDLKLPDEGLEGAVGLRFEVKSAQDKAENDFKESYLMLERQRGDLLLGYLPPTDTWESRTVFIDASMSIGDVRKIRVGANPRGMRATFWIRNVELLDAPKEKKRKNP